MKKRKLLEKALTKPAALKFIEACRLAEAYGYRLDRISGSHHYLRTSANKSSFEFSERSRNGESLSGAAIASQAEEFNLEFAE